MLKLEVSERPLKEQTTTAASEIGKLEKPKGPKSLWIAGWATVWST
jgi:hypothetical protein